MKLWVAERFGKAPWEIDEVDGETLAYWFEVLSIQNGYQPWIAKGIETGKRRAEANKR